MDNFVDNQVPPTWEGVRGRTLRQDNQPHQKQSRQSKTDCRTLFAMTKTGNERDWNEKLVFLRERVYEVPRQETLHSRLFEFL